MVKSKQKKIIGNPSLIYLFCYERPRLVTHISKYLGITRKAVYDNLREKLHNHVVEKTNILKPKEEKGILSISDPYIDKLVEDSKLSQKFIDKEIKILKDVMNSKLTREAFFRWNIISLDASRYDAYKYFLQKLKGICMTRMLLREIDLKDITKEKIKENGKNKKVSLKKNLESQNSLDILENLLNLFNISNELKSFFRDEYLNASKKIMNEEVILEEGFNFMQMPVPLARKVLACVDPHTAPFFAINLNDFINLKVKK